MHRLEVIFAGFPEMNRRKVLTSLLFVVVLALAHQKQAHSSSDTGEEALATQASLASVATRVTASELSQAISTQMLGLGGAFRIRLGQSGYLKPNGWLLASSAATPLPQDQGFDWSAISLWATPVISGVDNRIKPLTSEGTVKVLILGAEHSSEDQRRVLGVAVSKDWLDIDTTYNQGSVTGTGLTVSPYLAYQINNDWSLDASLGLGESNTTVRTTNLRSEPKLDRQFVSVGLTRTQTQGSWFILYKGGLSSSEDKVKSFISSNGQSSAASTTRLNQLKLGVYALYNRPPISPFLAIYQLSNDFSVSGSSAVKPKEYSSVQQLQIGLNASSGPLYGALAYQTERGRSQWRLYGGIRY